MRTLEQDSTGIRTVHGSVAANGSINSGTGFVVLKTGTGVYVIRFIPTLKTILSAVCAAGPAGSGFVWTLIYPDYVSVTTYNNALAAIDLGVNFTVRGLAR